MGFFDDLYKAQSLKDHQKSIAQQKRSGEYHKAQVDSTEYTNVLLAALLREQQYTNQLIAQQMGHCYTPSPIPGRVA